ncbi:hypothetical protein GCM10009662_47310 [Catellatospora coxensis]|uniref:Uncharacterized protein n=1 Tax=Catellatospora coxensis TaxID=310354 RepID=A0A8J3PBH7_9ACTN|nr:hypothetical protein Cco03nite_80560 [Catellatospora coxensis]
MLRGGSDPGSSGVPAVPDAAVPVQVPAQAASSGLSPQEEQHEELPQHDDALLLELPEEAPVSGRAAESRIEVTDRSSSSSSSTLKSSFDI